MYNILIVEDEELVRESIRVQMNWEEFGFQCIGDCEDGEQALDFIERQKPDVVLTDIGMPFMDGLALTHELAVRYPNIKVVILTGYDDFDYAQQAVKLQAVDYLLKPITSAELGEVLRKLRAELDREHNHRRDYEQLQRRLSESKPQLRERFLERMMTAAMSEKARASGCEYYEIAWAGPYLIEAAIQIDEFVAKPSPTPSDEELFRFAVFNIAQEIASRSNTAHVYRDVDNRTFVLFSGGDAEAMRDSAMDTAQQIHRAVTSLLPLRIAVGIGHVGQWHRDIRHVHQSSLSALDYRFAAGVQTVIRLSDMEWRERPSLLSIVAWEQELVTLLKTGTDQQMMDWADRFFTSLREHLFPVDICRLYIHRIVLTLLHTLYELGGESASILGDADNPATAMKTFAKLEEAQAWLKNVCMQAMEAIRRFREDQNALQVDKAIAYVRENYADPELSLTAVCKHISMSTSYFSALFKHYTGCTFVEFVTRERMDKAKELLKLTAMKNYEIAYAVGYSDPHYFSGAFKKHVGSSPTEFRMKTLKEKA